MNQQPWQDLLNQGNASEALKLYRANDSSAGNNRDEMTENALELFADVQELLREKNPVKAKQKLSQHGQAPDWAEQLFSDLQVQLATLEQATKTLDKHDPDKTLELLQNITVPLLVAEKETLRGTALIYHNDTSNAKVAFEKALSVDPQHYRAITNLGNLALEANNSDEAIALYERALKLKEDFANAHHNLAVAYRKKGQVSKSVSELKKAQRASQQKLRDEARQMFRGTQNSKYLRWLLYAAGAVVLFLIFRSRL
jgi:tetratricopeptide (TPR) repeat protein